VAGVCEIEDNKVNRSGSCGFDIRHTRFCARGALLRRPWRGSLYGDAMKNECKDMLEDIMGHRRRMSAASGGLRAMETAFLAVRPKP
jgi:hypothetical protein